MNTDYLIRLILTIIPITHFEPFFKFRWANIITEKVALVQTVKFMGKTSAVL